MGLHYGNWPKPRPAGLEYACKPHHVETACAACRDGPPLDILYFRNPSDSRSVPSDPGPARVPVLQAFVRSTGHTFPRSKWQALIGSAFKRARSAEHYGTTGNLRHLTVELVPIPHLQSIQTALIEQGLGRTLVWVWTQHEIECGEAKLAVTFDPDSGDLHYEQVSGEFTLE